MTAIAKTISDGVEVYFKESGDRIKESIGFIIVLVIITAMIFWCLPEGTLN